MAAGGDKLLHFMEKVMNPGELSDFNHALNDIYYLVKKRNAGSVLV